VPTPLSGGEIVAERAQERIAPSSIRSLIDRKTSSFWAAAAAKATRGLFCDLFRMPSGTSESPRSMSARALKRVGLGESPQGLGGRLASSEAG